ncbi:hypothetical protein [Candidatus Halocynthiibacter alkanivorans]|uniref:hypothetical protein n=1 Tax=Candidatus Halocynthiibacter alkanivorans TaxID=2267619 RepID=UPI000DF1682D|nr:hypothetical protein [Candidatus Halocynthiibacter alkanivorans]
MINFPSTEHVQRHLDASRVPASIFVTSAIAVSLNFTHVLDAVEAYFETRGVSAAAFYLANFAALFGVRWFVRSRRA